jgi:LysR family transcriptional regulator, glycine cleavage system transcriptional activator
MKDLPLNMLRAFALVYETGGVRPAARKLGVTHSSVSRHIHELEKWMEIPLFEPKEGRSLRFTASGSQLGQQSLEALNNLENAVGNIREARWGNSIVIQTTPSIATRWLLPRLAAFEEEFKWVELSITVDQRVRSLPDNNADMSLRMGPGPWPGEFSTPFMHDLLIPVMSPHYWQEKGRPEEVGSLENLRLLHDRDPNCSWRVFTQQVEIELPNLRAGPRYSSTDLVLRAAEQGLGVALARLSMAEDSLKSGQLIAPFKHCAAPLENAYWVMKQGHGLARKTEEVFEKWLLSEGQRTNQYLFKFGQSE